MKITQNQIERAKSISLLDVCAPFVEMRQSGNCWRGLCPFHDDQNPSFTIYPENRYYCFGCHAQGDVIDFIKEIKGLSFQEAVLDLLGESSAVPVPTVPRAKKKAKPKQEKTQGLAPEVIALLSGFTSTLVSSSEEAKFVKTWLAKRGISVEMIKFYQLGLNLKNEKEKIKCKDGRKIFLFRGLVIPRHTPQMQLCGIKIRVFKNIKSFAHKKEKGEKPIIEKYTSVSGSSKGWALYNPKKVVFENIIFVVESELDAIVVSWYSGCRCVAVTKNQLSNREMMQYIDKFNRIIFIPDKEQELQKAVNLFINGAREVGINIERKLISLFFDAKDPGEHIEKFGLESFQKRIESVLKDVTGVGATNLDKKEEKHQQHQHQDNPIKKLIMMLKKYPIKLDLRNGIKLIEPDGWAHKHWDVARKISDIVFCCNETSPWLEQNTGKVLNFYKK